MAYQAEISRSNPTCFVFLLDQSQSMQDPLGASITPQRKADMLADVVNRLLADLTLRCAKEEGVRDYFHVALLGYGGKVASAFRGVLANRDLVPLSEVGNFPARMESRQKKVPDGAGGLVEQSVKFPVWVDAVAEGGTPMCSAMARAKVIVEQWLALRPACYPPVVVNVTDGESTDGDPTQAAEDLKALSSTDGNVLLFNLHLSSDPSQPISYPDGEERLPNDFARQLFRMSSYLPRHLQAYAGDKGYHINEGTRGFVFNAEATEVVQFLDIGTRVSALR